MTWKFTYKELLLVVGVVVALAVVMVFWFKNSEAKTFKISRSTIQEVPASSTVLTDFLEKSIPKVTF